MARKFKRKPEAVNRYGAIAERCGTDTSVSRRKHSTDYALSLRLGCFRGASSRTMMRGNPAGWVCTSCRRWGATVVAVWWGKSCRLSLKVMLIGPQLVQCECRPCEQRPA